MKPLRLLVTYTAKSGQRDAFLRAVLQSGVPETIRQEDGCLRYDYFLSAERPDEILLIEEWASAEQQQTHLRRREACLRCGNPPVFCCSWQRDWESQSSL